jgi:hypothetical protein
MVAENSGFDNAIIKNLDTERDNEKEIPCMFKPKEFSVNKTNTWNSKPVRDGNVPKLAFGGGNSRDLKMQLFFDTYEAGTDVTKHTDKVFQLMKVTTVKREGKNRQEPPRCQFIWGNYHSFTAIVDSISQKFTLFLSNGTPVRSTLDVSFKQAIDDTTEEVKGSSQQSPTTMTKPGHRTRRVHGGETLDWIAFEEYGDATQWRFLADVNGLADPMSLSAGMLLSIPPLA